MRYIYYECIFISIYLIVLPISNSKGQEFGFDRTKEDSITLPNFNDTIIKEEYNISGKYILNNAKYNYVKFLEKSFFTNIIISEKSFFDHITFCKEVRFVSSSFKETEYNNIYFESDIEFENSHFNGDLRFLNVNFFKKVNFGNAYFQKCAFLSNNFRDIVDFENVEFSKNTFFIENKFNKKVSFSNAKFVGDIEFYFNELPDTLNLSGLRLDSIRHDIDFRYCFLNSLKRLNKEKCIVSLLKTDISKIVLPAHLFTVDTESDFFHFMENEETKLDEITRIYEQLIKKSKDLGLMSSAEGWDIEYQIKKNIAQYKLIGYFLNFVNLYWWNFGYSRGRILWFWLPLLYLLFSVINYFNLDWMVKKVYFDDEFGKNYKLKYQNVKTVNERISYSLFYTSAIYFNFRLRHEAVNYKNLPGLLYLYFIYLVGSINVAFGVLSYIPQS